MESRVFTSAMRSSDLVSVERGAHFPSKERRMYIGNPRSMLQNTPRRKKRSKAAPGSTKDPRGKIEPGRVVLRLRLQPRGLNSGGFGSSPKEISPAVSLSQQMEGACNMYVCIIKQSIS